MSGEEVVGALPVVNVGDRVTRMLAGTIPMEMVVTAVDGEFIHCGPWKFDREFGWEVDEDLGWGIVNQGGGMYTGSFLKLAKPEE